MKKVLLLALLGSFAAQAMDAPDLRTKTTKITKATLVYIKNNTPTDWKFIGFFYPKEQWNTKQIFSITIPANSTTQIGRQLFLSSEKLITKIQKKQPFYSLKQIGGPADYKLVGSNVLKLRGQVKMTDARSIISNILRIAPGQPFTIELSRPGYLYKAELKLLKAETLVDVAVNKMVKRIINGEMTLESLKAKFPAELFEKIEKELGK